MEQVIRETALEGDRGTNRRGMSSSAWNNTKAMVRGTEGTKLSCPGVDHRSVCLIS